MINSNQVGIPNEYAFYLTLIIGAIVSGATTIYIGLMYQFSPELRSWYVLLLGSLLGCLIWAVLIKVKVPVSRSMKLISILQYQGNGQPFYIGCIFLNQSGEIGFTSYLLSTTLILLISEVSKKYRLGPPVLIVCSSLSLLALYLDLITGASLIVKVINTIASWCQLFLLPSALLAILTDIILYISWEFSKDKGEVT
jgi:xanthine/uracil permease